jgi:hypothetical protein
MLNYDRAERTDRVDYNLRSTFIERFIYTLFQSKDEDIKKYLKPYFKPTYN